MASTIDWIFIIVGAAAVWFGSIVCVFDFIFARAYFIVGL
jgi:hypothetical protein